MKRFSWIAVVTVRDPSDSVGHRKIMNMAYRTISTTKRSGVIVFLHPKKTDSKSPYLLYLLKLNNDELENKGQERVFELRNVCWVTMCGLIPRASRSHQLLSVVFLLLLVPLYLSFTSFPFSFHIYLNQFFCFFCGVIQFIRHIVGYLFQCVQVS